MRALLLAIVLLAGCDGDTIRDCAYACQAADRGRRMLRYSQAEGCICEGGERPQ